MQIKFIKTFFVIVSASLTLITHISGQTKWMQTNSLPGGSIWAMETIGKNLFAGATNGGVYFSDDNGVTWIQRNGSFTRMEVCALAVNGTDIYAGTGGSFGAGVYKSSDNGLNWTNVTPSSMNKNSNVRSLAVNSSNIFAGTFGGGGIFRSSLSGISSSSWSSFNTGLTNENTGSLKIKGTTIYAGTYGNGVWVSPTNSPCWALTSATMPDNSDYISSIEFLGNTAFAGNISGLPVLYRSNNNGKTWKQSNTSIFKDKPVYAIRSSDLDVYAGTEGAGMLLSSDRGTTWSEFNEGFFKDSASVNQCGGNIRSILTSGSSIFAGTDCGVWKRTLHRKAVSQITPRQRATAISKYPFIIPLFNLNGRKIMPVIEAPHRSGHTNTTEALIR